MVDLYELEHRIADQRGEVERGVQQDHLLRQLRRPDRPGLALRSQSGFRCRLGLALIRLGTRLAA